MIEFIKKHYKKIIILSADVLCIVAALICQPLSAYMLSEESTCAWTLIGAKCMTCGGTHFVNDFLSFRFVDAFFDNQLMFIWTVYAIVSLVFLNLWLLFNLDFAKKMLKWMYSIPTLIIFGLSLIVFIVCRNLTFFGKCFHILAALLKKLADQLAAKMT